VRGVIEITLRSTYLSGGFKTVDGKLPARIKLLNWGTNATSEGPVIVDDLTASFFAANQKAIGRERVALDFEHNTVPGTPEYERTQEPRRTAGSLQLVCIPGEGIFGEALTYTGTGILHAADFEDLSLAPYLDKEGRVIAAHSAALTRTGATYGITFKAADAASLTASEKSLAADLKTLSASSGAVATKQTKTQDPMAEKYLSLPALAVLVGLSATAEEADVVSKLKERLTPASPVDLAPLSARIEAIENLAPLSARIEAIEKKSAPVVIDLAPLTARLDKFETRLNTESSASTSSEKARIVALFAKEGQAPVNPDTGKAYTAEELGNLDLPILRLLHANTAITVPLSARPRVTIDGKVIDPALKGRSRFVAAQERDMVVRN
jgi:hypothetical protein